MWLAALLVPGIPGALLTVRSRIAPGYVPPVSKIIINVN